MLGFSVLLSSFFRYYTRRYYHRFKKYRVSLNKWSAVKVLPHEASLRRKYGKVRHRIWRKTNNFLKWHGVDRKHSFFISLVWCSIFSYSVCSLTRLNTLCFNKHLSGGHSKQCGFYFYGDLVEQKSNLELFLMKHYGKESIRDVLRVLIDSEVTVPFAMPYTWKRPAYRTRKKGTTPRIDLFYTGNRARFSLILDLCVLNPCLISTVVKLVSEASSRSLLFKERHEWEQGYRHKAYYIKNTWSPDQKDELFYLMFKSTPWNYWSVYVYVIGCYLKRSCLLIDLGDSKSGDYYDSNLGVVPYSFPEGTQRSPWLRIESGVWEDLVEVRIVCRLTGKYYDIQTVNLKQTVYDIFIGRPIKAGWVRKAFMSYGHIKDVYNYFDFYIHRNHIDNI